MGRGAEQRVESLYTLTIGQEKIDYDGGDIFPPLADQSIVCVTAAGDPLDFERTIQ
jgi:hypothetical protein